MHRALLVYDSSCGPCTNFERFVHLLDLRRHIVPVPLTEADGLGLLDSIGSEKRYKSFHLLVDDEITSGTEAIPRLISLLPGGTAMSSGLAQWPFGLKVLNEAYSILSRSHDVGCPVQTSHMGHDGPIGSGLRTKAN